MMGKDISIAMSCMGLCGIYLWIMLDIPEPSFWDMPVIFLRDFGMEKDMGIGCYPLDYVGSFRICLRYPLGMGKELGDCLGCHA